MRRPKAPSRVTLLLVDSEAGPRRAAARKLRSRGFRVAQAGGCGQAITLLRASPPDAVVLDVATDSGAALATLAKLHAARPRVPVVMLADACETDIAMHSIELGAVDVLRKPTDIDHLSNRIRGLVASGAAAPREKTIAELMIPASAYRHVYEDEPVQHVIKVLTQSLFAPDPGKLIEKGRRSVLVFSRQEKFLGCIRLHDILDLLIAPARREAYQPVEAGMFVARCKVLGNATAGDLIGEQSFVNEEAPLMEAVLLMVVDGLINIPVLRKGRLVGMLTDRNLLLEICNLATGGITRMS
jgi:DNA-binding response OmpR family regulator